MTSMNIIIFIYLFSFIPIILFAVVFWSDIFKRKEFGKRPHYLLISIILFCATGTLAALTGLHATVFITDSSYMQFTLFTVFYIITFFFADYSIHRQRLVRSFFIEKFQSRLKAYFVFFLVLVVLSLTSVLLYALRPLFDGSLVKSVFQ